MHVRMTDHLVQYLSLGYFKALTNPNFARRTKRANKVYRTKVTNMLVIFLSQDTKINLWHYPTIK